MMCWPSSAWPRRLKFELQDRPTIPVSCQCRCSNPSSHSGRPEPSSNREPHRIVFFVQELAREFQSYFTRKKTDPILPPASVRAVAGWEKTWDFEKTAARLAWIEAIRCVYAAGLGLLGVTAPERMDLPAAVAAEDDGALA